jgi:Fur family transcriptional regulator, ferric uptake regulator
VTHAAHDPSAWTAHARRALAAAGFRSGGARTAVIEVLAEAPCGITAQGIFDMLRERGRRAGIASVYRALEQMAALRLVTRLDFGDGVSRFEPADPAGHHHHHLLCTACGRVDPFEDPDLERALAATAGRAGFAAEDHDVVLRGRCAGCAPA